MVNISHLNMFNLNSLVSRRPLVLFIALGAVLFLFSVHTTGIAKLNVGSTGASGGWTTSVSHGSPLAQLKKACAAPDPFEEKFGRPNLRMTRAYEGTFAHWPMRRRWRWRRRRRTHTHAPHRLFVQNTVVCQQDPPWRKGHSDYHRRQW